MDAPEPRPSPPGHVFDTVPLSGVTLEPGPPAPPSWADSWRLWLALGLATLMVACGLALAFGWVRLERAMDVRALFR